MRVSDKDANLTGDDLALHQFRCTVERHLMDDCPCFVEGVVAGKYLRKRYGFRFALIILDVRDQARFAPPRMVYEQFRVLPEDLIHETCVQLRHAAHVVHTVPLKPACRATGHHPEICDRAVIPQCLPVSLFVQKSDMVSGVFGCDIQRDLGEIKVRPNSRSGGDVIPVGDLIHQELGERYRVHFVRREIIGYVDKCFVDRVHVDVLRIEVIQIQRVDVCCILNVQSHSGRGNFVLDADRDLRQPAAFFYALRLHIRCNGKAQGIFSTCEIGDNEVRFEWIVPTLGALNRRIKRLHVYAKVCALLCHGGYSPILLICEAVES